MSGDRTNVQTMLDALPQHPELCNYTDPIARTAILDVAIWTGDVEMICMLLSIGMNPNTHREGHDIPLITAISSPTENVSEMIRILVGQGAHVNHPGILKTSAMHAAVAKSSVELIDLLLSLGAEINIQHPPDKCTPLWSAVLWNELEMVSALLARGADHRLRNEVDGSSPLDVAKARGSPKMVELLRAIRGDASH